MKPSQGEEKKCNAFSTEIAPKCLRRYLYALAWVDSFNRKKGVLLVNDTSEHTFDIPNIGCKTYIFEVRVVCPDIGTDAAALEARSTPKESRT